MKYTPEFTVSDSCVHIQLNRVVDSDPSGSAVVVLPSQTVCELAQHLAESGVAVESMTVTRDNGSGSVVLFTDRFTPNDKTPDMDWLDRVVDDEDGDLLLPLRSDGDRLTFNQMMEFLFNPHLNGLSSVVEKLRDEQTGPAPEPTEDVSLVTKETHPDESDESDSSAQPRQMMVIGETAFLHPAQMNEPVQENETVTNLDTVLEVESELSAPSDLPELGSGLRRRNVGVGESGVNTDNVDPFADAPVYGELDEDDTVHSTVAKAPLYAMLVLVGGWAAFGLTAAVYQMLH